MLPSGGGGEGGKKVGGRRGAYLFCSTGWKGRIVKPVIGWVGGGGDKGGKGALASSLFPCRSIWSLFAGLPDLGKMSIMDHPLFLRANTAQN